jgi:hypothetical protein
MNNKNVDKNPHVLCKCALMSCKNAENMADCMESIEIYVEMMIVWKLC